MPPRYIRTYQPNLFKPLEQCRYCGTFWGISTASPCNRDEHGRPACDLTICHSCGSPQCIVNGLSSGQCAVCFAGLLAGWHGSDGETCSYKRCGQPAVARGHGRRYVCAGHAAHQGIGRPHLEGWKLVE